MPLDHQKIIVRPIFTEKMSRLEEERKYCFQVQLGANKVDTVSYTHLRAHET